MFLTVEPAMLPGSSAPVVFSEPTNSNRSELLNSIAVHKMTPFSAKNIDPCLVHWDQCFWGRKGPFCNGRVVVELVFLSLLVGSCEFFHQLTLSRIHVVYFLIFLNI